MATLYINKENLINNVRNIKKKLNKNVKIIAMVKANAYGMGAVEITKFLEKENVDTFGVALVKEGVELRKNHINSKILVTSQFLKEDVKNIVKYDITVSLSDKNLADYLDAEARKQNKIANVHIKLDTGMTRLGVSCLDVIPFIQYIKENFKNINVEGIYTHLSSADSDDEYTKKQLTKFKDAVDNLKKANIKLDYIHCLNSAGTIQKDKYGMYQFTHVRVGNILYGYYPDESLEEEIKLKPVATLKAKILQIRDIKEDTYISYSRTAKVTDGAKIATIQIGYADGLRRSLSNNHYVYYKNKKCNIVGNICMDMCMIDVTDIESPKVSDKVEIFGKNIKVEEIAKKLDTINYEIISTVSNRVEIKYE